MNARRLMERTGVRWAALAAVALLMAGAGAGMAPPDAEAQAPPGTFTPKLAAGGHGVLVVSWAPPADNGSPITAYQIEHRKHPGGTWTVVHTLGAEARTATITGVNPGETHRVRMRARNDAGWGQMSWPLAEITLPTPAQPPAPTGGITITRGDGTLTATWLEADGASRYHVTYSANGGASWLLAAFGTARTSVTIVADNGATYIVGVRAGNNVGWSGWRNSAPAGPFTLTPPAAVASVTVTRADGTLTASWDAPTGATSYHVTYTDDGAQSWQLAALDHAGTSIDITADNAKTYIVGVRAKNAAGGSDWRNSAAAAPFTTAPDAPGSVTVTGRSDGTAQIVWSPSEGATGYEINQSADDGQTWTTAQTTGGGGGGGDSVSAASGGGAETEATITGLDNGATYTFGVRATNAGGASAQTVSAPAPPLLDGPANLTVTHSPAGTLNVSWTAMSNLWGYHIKYRTESGQWTSFERIGTSNSRTITGVDGGKTYIVAVRAEVDFGRTAWSYSDPVAGPSGGAPAAPTNVTISRTDDGKGNNTYNRTVSWTASAGATGYDVRVRPARDPRWVQVGTDVTASPFVGADCGCGTLDYVASVRAKNTHGDSAWTQSPVESAPLEPPPAPATVTISSRATSNNNTTVTVTWSAATQAASYELRSSTDGGTTWTTPTTGLTGASKTVTLSDTTKVYAFGVRARNAHGVSAWTQANELAAPTGLTVVRGKSGSIEHFDVSWTAVSGATHYDVNCSHAGVDWGLCGTATATTNSVRLAHASIADVRHYTVAVRARNASGGGPWARLYVGSVWPPIEPRNLTVTRSAGGTATFSLSQYYEDAYPVSHYNVYCAEGLTGAPSWTKCTGGDKVAAPPGQPATVTLTVSGLDDAKAYRFAVASVNYVGESLRRATASAARVTPTLTAGGITRTGATLSVGNYNAAWWYKGSQSNASCTPVTAGTTTAALTSLTAGTSYTYKVYGASGCANANELASETFTTAVTVGSVSNLSATQAGQFTVGSASSVNSRAGQAFTTGPSVSGYRLASITAAFAADVGTPGDIVVNLHEASGAAPGPVVANATFSGANPTTAGDHTFTCVGSGCDLAASTTYFVTFSVSGATGANHYVLTATTDDSETLTSASGWSLANAGVKKDGAGAWAVVQGGNAARITVTVAVNATLTASSITETGATLTLASATHTTNWSVKQVAPTSGTCAAQTTATHSLSTLTAGTGYVYRAYSGANCTTEIAAVAFSTAETTVSNLSETRANTDAPVGSLSSNIVIVANAFTTGSSADGYTLTSVTVNLGARTGSAASLEAGIYTDSSGVPSSTRRINLYSATPTNAGDQSWSCTGTCDLDPSTTYHLVLSATFPQNAPAAYYPWTLTTSDAQTNTPSGAGWTIADSRSQQANGGSWTSPSNAARFSVTAAPGAGLRASAVTGTTATLTLTGETGSWWLKETSPNTGTCTAGESDYSHALSSLTAGTTYTYKAYSDSACATTALQSVTFTTPELTASGITTTGATLTLASAAHTGNWSVRETSPSTGSCSNKTTATHNPGTLTAGSWYIYRAYSGSGCTAANEIAAVAFGTPLTVSNLSGLDLESVRVSSTEAKAQGFTTGSAAGGYTLQSVTFDSLLQYSASQITMTIRASLSNGHPGTTALATLSTSTSGNVPAGDVTYTCSGSGCALAPDTQYFVYISTSSGTPISSFALTGSDNETLVPSGNGWSIADAVRDQALSWDEFGNGAAVEIKVTAAPKPGLGASAITSTTATLTLTGETGSWWLKETSPNTGTCTAGESDYSHALSSLTAGTSYTYKAYSDSACATTALQSVTFATPVSLTASIDTATTATLTLAGLSSGTNWWLKETSPNTGTCTAGEADFSHALSSLNFVGGTSYTYRAYSDSSCATEIATTTFSVVAPGVPTGLSVNTSTWNASWTAPTVTGNVAAGITKYGVECKRSINSSNAGESTTTSKYVGGNQHCRNYSNHGNYVRVRAWNGDWGNWSGWHRHQ